jgi:hypothetical protein
VSDELAERVERGAALLDERRPGWWEKVSLQRLDLASECDCPLGQIWGGYIKGVAALFGGVRPLDTIMQGVPMRYGFDDPTFDYEEITDLWLAAIERRRAADRTTT